MRPHFAGGPEEGWRGGVRRIANRPYGLTQPTTAEKSSNATLQSVAALIRHCWQYQLLQEYPQRRFTVAISGETFAPEITFWQDEGDDGEQTGYEY